MFTNTEGIRFKVGDIVKNIGNGGYYKIIAFTEPVYDKRNWLVNYRVDIECLFAHDGATWGRGARVFTPCSTLRHLVHEDLLGIKKRRVDLQMLEDLLHDNIPN